MWVVFFFSHNNTWLRDWNSLDTLSRSKLIPQPPVTVDIIFLLLMRCIPAVTGWAHCWVSTQVPKYPEVAMLQWTVYDLFIYLFIRPEWCYAFVLCTIYVVIWVGAAINCFQCDCIACPDIYHQCPTTGQCIPPAWFCDLEDDCGDMSEETNCGELSYCFILVFYQIIISWF